MKEFYCIDCDNVWHDLDHSGCPLCHSMDVIDAGDTFTDTYPIIEDGHYEGGFHHYPHNFDDAGE